MLESNVNDELKQLDGELTGGDSSGDVQRALREAKAKYEVSVFHRLVKKEYNRTHFYIPCCSWNSASFARSRWRRNRNMLKRSVMYDAALLAFVVFQTLSSFSSIKRLANWRVL